MVGPLAKIGVHIREHIGTTERERGLSKTTDSHTPKTDTKEQPVSR